MSDTNTTTLSELIHAIQLSLQPYRGASGSENPFSEISTTYDGSVDAQANKQVVDRSRRDSGISVSSNSSPILRTGEFPSARSRGFSDVGITPLSRSTTQVHKIDTKSVITSNQITQSPTRLRYESPSHLSAASPLSGLYSSDRKPVSRDQRPKPMSLNKILRDRQLHSAPSILTTPQFSARKGCILAQNCSIEATRFRATTESGLPAWWCRYDNLVVFDGMGAEDGSGQQVVKTRSAKGLGVANRHGKEEVVIVNLDCAHCRDALGLKIWKYTARLCERSVCAVCKARCKEEWHRSLGMLDAGEMDVPPPFSSQSTNSDVPDHAKATDEDITTSTIESSPVIPLENTESTISTITAETGPDENR